MKHIIIMVLAVLFGGICQAQTEHMKFKGIPMEGTLRSFTNQLEAKGYTCIGIQNGVSMLTGEFAGYKGCVIGVVTDNSGTICKVVVLFPEMDTWSDLYACYATYKEMLTEKYGEPSQSNEYFEEPYNNEAADKIYGVKFDNCKYYSDFSCDQGSITLEISHDGVTKCFVKLSYYDNANQDNLRKQIMDDL